MITTVAELLNIFLDKEKKRLKDFAFVNHGPMIGDMYEGLTKKFLEMSVFENLNLKITSGKIDDGTGRLSSQIDCMLVEGEGEKLPYTDMYIYNISKVLVIIEVKKNLYTNDLASAYANLLSPYGKLDIEKKYWGINLRQSFRLLTNKDIYSLFTEDFDHLTSSEQYLAVSLDHDDRLPVRIIFGYDGFVSEYSLRESFLNYIEDNINLRQDNEVKNLSPYNLPSLIICGNHSLIKLNGMPYAMTLEHGIPHEVPGTDKNGWFPIYGSSSENKALIFLEIIWSRLRSRYALDKNIFGDDLNIEHINPLLFAKGIDDHRHGWMYCAHSMKSSDLQTPIHELSWQPKEITLQQAYIFKMLIEGESIFIDSDKFFAIVRELNLNASNFVRDLEQTKLLYIDYNSELRFLTNQLQIVILSDGRILAADNYDGRFSKWLNANGYPKLIP